ncbi:chorismate pyruvate-lyase family protein [Bacillus haynesii]|uniref:chorismate--pyruvate lyase family protein n=1 Tax=Bacillus haynesii TaxID=1925021 RepID=UPI00227FA9B1|nr:chorismate pyruvate-lyase family protein [Bacillus haynesii]MCY8344341.1 chorismate pyruvate-lyase family protein [Bacillus haynesii]MCY8348414.1 chorismate pyruvate-lyase family protein [Bacillus haynesii]MCY8557407.1 chorismate pyruvate-lyase family protein [Bacillus haynesii]MCY9370089.1 chorismate pyruvate-lyase family protein [Bacillus haynesii]
MSVSHFFPKALVALVKDMLTKTDGSTTKAIETLIGGKTEIEVFQQNNIDYDKLSPEEARLFQRDDDILFRTSSLKTGDDYLSYNYVYVKTNLLPPAIKQDLQEERLPIGKIIAELESRREIFSTGDCLGKHFTQLVPVSADQTYAFKKYQIISGRQCMFYVCELFDLEKICKLTAG